MRDIQEIIRQIRNNVITYLYLNHQIGATETKELAEALKINKSINIIDFRYNQIGDAGAKELAEALKFNCTITYLNLQNNQIGYVVAKEIETALQINRDIAVKAKQETEILKQQQAEAAKLKAIEEAKVKEYIPEIPVAKLFEVAAGDNQFDNECIKNFIDKILADNQGATDEHKALINKLKDNGSIHLFYKPTDEGELVVPDLLAAIDGSSKYSDATGDMVNIAISKKAMECSSHLLNTASNNFNQLLEVIVKAIGNATKCLNFNPLNAFSENYNLVKDWIPSSINYHELKQHSEGEYFLELELLSRLQQIFSKPIDSISNALINF